jgi:oxygen-independent coproporphyrinogen-3 oxidase
MKTDKLPGLYIHIPFCQRKCRYCDFFSVCPEAGQPGRWKEALLREAGHYAGFSELFGSLYLGGGTPSVLPVGMLDEIISSLRKIYDFESSAEVTIEINPEDVTSDFVGALNDMGINRLSLGVQSFRDNELELLGRRHSAADAERGLEICLDSDIDNVSLDLIFALPYQTLKQWEYNLRRAMSFRPDHLSCYQLTLKEGTEMDRLASEGQLLFPGEEEQRDMFIATSGELTGAGYSHYEVSSFALGDRSRSRHNLVYWRHLPYLGLGPSAHSFDGSTRWWNSSSLDRYIEKADGETAGFEELSREKLDLEKIFLGLRTSLGVDLALARRYQGSEGVIEMLNARGLTEVRDGRLVPTLQGYLFADSIPLYFA